MEEGKGVGKRALVSLYIALVYLILVWIGLDRIRSAQSRSDWGELGELG